eukprot:752609-Hanusia_phi.AAC.2
MMCEQEARVDRFGRLRQLILSIRKLAEQTSSPPALLDHGKWGAGSGHISSVPSRCHRPFSVWDAGRAGGDEGQGWGKAGHSWMWAAFVMMATASVMTFVHDRVPDMAKVRERRGGQGEEEREKEEGAEEDGEEERKEEGEEERRGRGRGRKSGRGYDGGGRREEVVIEG